MEATRKKKILIIISAVLSAILFFIVIFRPKKDDPVLNNVSDINDLRNELEAEKNKYNADISRLNNNVLSLKREIHGKKSKSNKPPERNEIEPTPKKRKAVEIDDADDDLESDDTV